MTQSKVLYRMVLQSTTMYYTVRTRTKTNYKTAKNAKRVTKVFQSTTTYYKALQAIATY